MNFEIIESRKTNALTLQKLLCDNGYEVKIVTIGIDTSITASPPIEYMYIAPRICFISKMGGSVDIKNPSISIEDMPLFVEWAEKAKELSSYIYNNYDKILDEFNLFFKSR